MKIVWPYFCTKKNTYEKKHEVINWLAVQSEVRQRGKRGRKKLNKGWKVAKTRFLSPPRLKVAFQIKKPKLLECSFSNYCAVFGKKNPWELLQGNCSGGTKGHTPCFIHKPAVIMCNKVPALPRGRQQRRRRRHKVRKRLHGVALRYTKPASSFYDTLNGAVCAFRQWECSEHGGSETIITTWVTQEILDGNLQSRRLQTQAHQRVTVLRWHVVVSLPSVDLIGLFMHLLCVLNATVS